MFVKRCHQISKLSYRHLPVQKAVDFKCMKRAQNSMIDNPIAHNERSVSWVTWKYLQNLCKQWLILINLRRMYTKNQISPLLVSRRSSSCRFCHFFVGENLDREVFSEKNLLTRFWRVFSSLFPLTNLSVIIANSSWTTAMFLANNLVFLDEWFHYRSK